MCRQAVLHAGCWHVELHDALLSKGTAEEQPWENMGGCHQMAGLCWVWASSGIQRSHTGGFPGLCHDSYTWEELFWAEAGPLTLMNAWSFPSCWLPLWTNFFFFHNIFFFFAPLYHSGLLFQFCCLSSGCLHSCLSLPCQMNAVKCRVNSFSALCAGNPQHSGSSPSLSIFALQKLTEITCSQSPQWTSITLEKSV